MLSRNTDVGSFYMSSSIRLSVTFSERLLSNIHKATSIRREGNIKKELLLFLNLFYTN